MENYDFLGRGWAFPPHFDRLSEEADMAVGEDDVRQSLLIILSTKLGERFLRPDFGIDLTGFQFQSPSSAIMLRLEDLIKRTLIIQEPRIDDITVSVSPKTDDEGVLMVDIRYTVIETDTQDNLVFPFYLQGE